MSKPFDLEKALTGEPVKTRRGRKAYVKYNLKAEGVKCTTYSEIQGYVVNTDNELFYACAWNENGMYQNFDSEDDIIGMWEEPRPTVTLTLPCPLKEPQDSMWFINNNFEVHHSNFKEERHNHHIISKDFLEEGRYFATEADAQAWLDAMQNSRK